MKVLQIARNAFGENSRKPVFIVLLAIAALAIFGSQFFNFFNLQKETGIVKEMGVATILVVGLLVVVFSTSSQIAGEIEGRATVAVLSKPVGRGEYIFGKFLGIAASIAVVTAVLLVVLLLTVYTYTEWVEPAQDPHPAPGGEDLPFLAASIGLVKAGVLAFFGLIAIAAVGVLVSTRYPLAVNAAVCFAVFLAGNLIDYFDTQTAGVSAGGIIFFLKLLIPNVQYFNISAVLDSGTPISATYILLVCLYGTAYSGAVLFAAAVLFERKEIM